MKKYLLASSLLLVSSITSFGGGYQLNLEGLRQYAMGGTGAAWPWDASTIFYNPGGLARLKSIQVYGSVSEIMPGTAYGNAITQTSVQSVKQTFTPFNLYIGGPIQEGSKWALGLGIYTPFGAGLQWPDQWIGRYVVQSINLQTFFFQPTISYRINDFFSVGAGFVYAAGSIDLQQALPIHGLAGPTDPNGDGGEADLHGTANGVGFNLGVQMKVNNQIQIGVTYRSQVNMNVGSGTANFTVPASLRDSFPNTKFDSQLPLPQVATVGIGYRPIEKLTLQFDMSYTGWNSFDSLRINFAQHTSSLQDMHAPEHYRNTLTPKIGACYKINKILSVMAGGYYDPTPVTNGFVSPVLPDADRIAVSCGLSIKPFPRFTILAAFEGTMGLKRTGNYNYNAATGTYEFTGTYKTEAATPGIGAYYNF